MNKIEKTTVNQTSKIVVPITNDNIEDDLRELTVEELYTRLNYQETDPKIIKLIKNIIKEKK